MRRKMCVCIALVAALTVFVGAGIVSAAEYPSRPFEFIAPSGAGGGWDTTIRMAAKVLAD